MHLLLVEPSTRPLSGDDGRTSEVELAPTQMRLCLPYLAGLFAADCEVTIVYDMFGDVTSQVDLASFDLVGVTCTGHSGQIVRAMEIGLALKQLGVRTLVGGPVTVQDQRAFVPLLRRFLDCVVVGEAETVLLDLLSDLRDGVLRREYSSGAFSRFADTPLPRFDLAQLHRFEEPHVFPAQTARGCPRSCAFCSEPMYGPWRNRPVNEVIREMEHYAEAHGATRVVFRDDDFLIHPRRSREMLPALRGVGLEWACQTDLNLTRHMDVVDLAIDAGMKAVCFGLESVDEQNRSDLGKTFFDMTDVPELLARLTDSGVEVKMNIIFGLDNDTPETFDRTVDFMLEHKVSAWYANILSPEVGTPIHTKLARERRLRPVPPLYINDDSVRRLAGEAAVRRSFLEAEDPRLVGFQPRHLSAERLVELTREARAKFLAESRQPSWIEGRVDY